MRQRWSAAHRQSVALLAEGVDRNIVAIDQFDFLECRPPRGEHTSNPLSIRLHSLSFLQAGHRFGGQQPFSMQTSGGTAFCEPAAGLFSCRLSFTGTHRVISLRSNLIAKAFSTPPVELVVVARSSYPKQKQQAA